MSSQLMRICGQSELGKSQELMPNFRNSQIDFIYIDGSHKATDVLIDAINSWQAIREGGLLIFDDYEWSLHMPETERPKIAIDAFLEVFTGEYCLLHKDYQIIIQKSTYSEGEVYDCCMAESR